MPTTSHAWTSDRSAVRRDLAIITAASIAAAFLSVRFELSETLLAWTQRHERFQLDELPGILLVIALCLAWFAWRRYREARHEIARRSEAEARLAGALADNRTLGEQYVRRWDSDQKRLARELHDELGQYINAIKIDAVWIRDQSKNTPPRIAQAASAIIENTNHVHASIGDIIRRLRPVGLDDLGLSAALEHHVDCWRKRLQTTTFGLSIDDDVDDLCEAVNLTVYRLAQEGLTNVARHARAKRVDIELARSAHHTADRREIVFSVTDDGIGAPAAAHGGGFGLLGMRERVEQLGGEFSVSTAPGRGFRFVARLPAESRGRDA